MLAAPTCCRLPRPPPVGSRSSNAAAYDETHKRREATKVRVVGQGCSGLLILFGAAAARACAAGGVVCVFWWAGSRLTCLKFAFFLVRAMCYLWLNVGAPAGRLYSLFRSPLPDPLPTPADLGPRPLLALCSPSWLLFSVLEDRGLELERFFLS